MTVSDWVPPEPGAQGWNVPLDEKLIELVTGVNDSVQPDDLAPYVTTEAANSTYARLEVVQLSDYLSPTRVEGSTDDTPAVTAAIAALPAEGGRLVWARANVRIASAMDFDKPVIVMGAHRGKSKLTVTATKLISISASDVTFTDMGFHGDALPDGSSLLFSDKTVASNHSNWRFERCLFDDCGNLRFTKIGRIQTSGVPATTGTDLADGLALIDCEITGLRGSYGVEIGGVDGALVQGCHIHHNGINAVSGEGLKVIASATNVRIIGNEINDNTRDGLDAYDALSVTVIGNDIHDNGVNGVEVKWASTDAHTVDRLIMIGNRVYGNVGDGMNVGVPLSIITGNVCHGNGINGIRFGSASDSAATPTEQSTIADNVCNNNTGSGILLGNAVEKVTVAGNQCHSNSVSGIALNGLCVDITVANNHAFGNLGRGISVAGTRVQLWGNRSQDADGVAFMDSATFVSVNGYGEEAATVGGKPTTAEWPGGATVKNTADGTVWRKVGTDWVNVGANPTRYLNTSYYTPRGARSAFATVLNRLTFVPFELTADKTVTSIGCEVTVAAAISTVRLGIYKIGPTGIPTDLVIDAGTVDSSTTGGKEVAISQALVAGMYALAAVAQGGTPTVRTITGGGALDVGAGSLASSTQSNPQTGFYASSIAGALPATATVVDRSLTPTLVSVKLA